MTTPKRGARFLHRRLVTTTSQRQPETCRITAVRGGTVYYRTRDGAGAKFYVDRDRLDEMAVLRWLDGGEQP